MIVIAHGDVVEYCAAHGMTIVDKYVGELEEYDVRGTILVTAEQLEKHEYYYLKYKMLRRKVELICVHWCDSEFREFVEYVAARETGRYIGRLPFGFRRIGGETVADERGVAIARRIITMRDSGATYKAIQEDPDVHHLDGRRMSISTIQVILKNRSKYGC